MTSRMKPPLWFWSAAVLLALWQVMGCFACNQQIRLGAAAMGPVDEWSLKYFASLPAWYNWVYVVATFGGLLGSVALLFRTRRAEYFFWLSFAAIIVMFGYAFLATDLIEHKGIAQVLPFPALIAAIGAFSIWLARYAAKAGWLKG